MDGQTNWVVVDQIRTIDKTRITKTITKLGNEAINQLKMIIKETFVD